MTTSPEGRSLIKKFEGFEKKAYQCSAGVWTIGYGHTGGVKPGDEVAEAEAEALLAADLAVFEAAVNAELDGLTQNQFDALVSFTYNLGEGCLRKSTLLRLAKINPQDARIRHEFLRYVYAGSKPLEGLKKRRAAEADLYFR